MIQKIQTLQKRLIAKTEEIVEKDMVIRAKEQLYQDVKNILRLQPGPEVAVEKNVLEHNLKEKKRQMKAMASELNMLQAQVNEYKVSSTFLSTLPSLILSYSVQFLLEQKDREIQGTKRKLYIQRRKDKLLLSRS